MIEPLITLEEAASMVGQGITARMLRGWHKEGRLETQRVGRRLRTTATKVREAIERGWQGSYYTAPTPSTAPGQSHACSDTFGTSSGMKDEGAESVARAASLATELALEKRLGGSYSHNNGRPKAPVIHLK